MGDGLLALGRHCLLELYDCDAALLNDSEFIRATLKEAAERAGATFLGEIAHSFTPQGVTALALLSESHISIHTWPELGYAAADVFTCGDHCVPETACRFMVGAFQARRHDMRRITRGAPAQIALIERAAERSSDSAPTGAGAAGAAEPDSDEAFLWVAPGFARTSGSTSTSHRGMSISTV